MRGTSLMELVAVLALLAAGGALFAPTARRLGDRTAVVSARESVASMLVEARTAAFARGEGSLRLSGPPWRGWVTAGDSVLQVVDLQEEIGVSLVLSGGRMAAELRYGALGLGRFTSETVEFRKGRARARLVVSSYGRIRRE